MTTTIRFLLLGVASVILAALVCISIHRRSQSLLSNNHQLSLSSSLRRLSIDDYSDPKTVVPQDKEVSIHVYIKASGKHPWIERALLIADTWAKEVDDITFMLDNNNHEEVSEAFGARPWVKVKHIEGTDKQGQYKVRNGDEEEMKAMVAEAYKAQRLKTRAVFTEEEEQNSKADWICYIDDDMVVNVSNLKKELIEKEPECAPDCIIGDKRMHGTYYTNGAWCMNKDLVQRTTALLKDKTDEELRWKKTDDLDFHRFVTSNALGVEITDSDQIFSELAFQKDEPKRMKYGMERDEFAEKISPTLAVYHIGLSPNSSSSTEKYKYN